MGPFTGAKALLVLVVLPALAQADLRTELRNFVEALGAGTSPAVQGISLHYPELVLEIYRRREHAPLWVEEGPLHGALDELTEAIRQSADHGLNPAHYHLASLTAADHTALITEVLATDAFLAQADHRARGAVSPAELDPDWHLPRPAADPLAALQQASSYQTGVRTVLESLWPDNEDYQALLARRREIQALGSADADKVPAGPLLRPGQTDPRIVALKQRLLGPGDYDGVYDETLRQAVLEFQRAAGLETDGIVGTATLEVMNAGRFSWIDRLDANLERLRWLPDDRPETYLRVNIADFSLYAVERGEVALRMDVIVGRPYRQTPSFADAIKYLVFNPYWYVPHKLAVQDKLPALKEDAAAAAAQGFEVKLPDTETFVPVDQTHWSDVTPRTFRYLLRQRPGPQNALGRVKFMMPNVYSIYLHDTPSRELFDRRERTFSSGCVRVAAPMTLARWMLTQDGRPELAARIPEWLASGEATTVYLKRPIPTYLVYFTAFANAEGEVVFRRDLYQRDGGIVAALRADEPRLTSALSLP